MVNQFFVGLWSFMVSLVIIVFLPTVSSINNLLVIRRGSYILFSRLRLLLCAGMCLTAVLVVNLLTILLIKYDDIQTVLFVRFFPTNPYYLYFVCLFLLLYINKKRINYFPIGCFLIGCVIATLSVCTPIISPMITALTNAFTQFHHHRITSIELFITINALALVSLIIPLVMYSNIVLNFLSRRMLLLDSLNKIHYFISKSIIVVLLAFFAQSTSYKIAFIAGILLFIVHKIDQKIPSKKYLIVAIALSSLVVCSFTTLSMLKNNYQKTKMQLSKK